MSELHFMGFFRLLPLICLLSSTSGQLAAADAFTFQKDDRVVLLGSTFIERETRYGAIEGALSVIPDLPDLSFRNLGWSGDSVFGHARSYFGPPKEGLERLGKDLEQLKPTVVMVCYGTNIALEGTEGFPEFVKGYKALLDLIAEKAEKPRLILIAPPPFENLTPPFPNLDAANLALQELGIQLAALAKERDARFIDLPSLLGSGAARSAAPLTDNGIHYGAVGYQRIAEQICNALGYPDTPRPTAQLREFIVEKNLLFFRRWRPSNETYLRGFRAHEQGNNAAELDLFDPLIAEAEARIIANKKQPPPALIRP